MVNLNRHRVVTLTEYYTTISLNDKVNNKWSDSTKDDVIINWSIAKATYNMSAAGWDYSEAFTWDGTEKTVSVTGLPSGVTVTEYTGNTATIVGSYSATAVLAYDQINYNKPSVAELNWKIETLEVSKPVVDAGSLTYNGSEQGIDIPVSSYYSVTGITSLVNAGNYTATISLNDKVNTAWTDGSVDDIPISWSIGKATYSMSAAAWDYSEAFTWDGTKKTVSVTGLPLGVTVTEYTGNTATAVGSYSATAVLAYDVWNYFEPLMPSLQWMIERGYLNLNIIELWDNVLAVSNGEKYEDIRNATFRWYRDGVLLQGNKQYISFEGAIPAGVYRAEVFVEDKLAVSLDYTVVSAIKAKVYPNPLLSGDCLVVEMGEERPGNEMAQVFNMSGFPVRASVERQSAGYRITGLTTPGTYFVRVFTSEHTIATLKVIVK